MNEVGNRKSSQNGKMSCSDIQDVLFDYMTRELGDARSVLVREHIRKCESCRAAAADIQATLDLLKKVSGAGDDMPSKLSRKRRKRIIRAMMHPVWDWISVNHFIVSIVVMGVVILAALLVLRVLEPWHMGGPPDGVSVRIRMQGEQEPLEEPEGAP